MKLSRFAWSFTLFSVYWYIGCLQQYVRNVALKVSRYFRVRTLTRSVQHWSLSFHITSFQNRLYGRYKWSDTRHYTTNIRVVKVYYCPIVFFRVRMILVSCSRPISWHELIISKRRQKQLLHDMDNWGDSSIALFVSRFNCIKKGVSADADPHYQKLYGRVTDVCSNRRGQPSPSAMKEPRPGRNPSVIRFASPSGKYDSLRRMYECPRRAV